MRTSLPHVLAAGDCVHTHHRLLPEPTYLPLGSTAHKQGRVAGATAAGRPAAFAGSLGTQVVKVFDLVAARTGLRDAQAVEAGHRPLTVAGRADDHKAYYPGATPIAMRWTGDRRTGRLLGVQLVGRRPAEIAKRVDVAAAALFAGLDRRAGQRPGPVLHPAAGQSLGRAAGRRPGVDSHCPPPHGSLTGDRPATLEGRAPIPQAAPTPPARGGCRRVAGAASGRRSRPVRPCAPCRRAPGGPMVAAEQFHRG